MLEEKNSYMNYYKKDDVINMEKTLEATKSKVTKIS